MLIGQPSKEHAPAGDNGYARGFELFLVLMVYLTGCTAGSTAPLSGAPPDSAALSASKQAPASSAVTADAGLRVLNTYRAAAKLPPLTEDAALSAGDRAHALYLVKNYGQQIKSDQNLGVNFHLEDRNRPSFTYAGFVAGRSSDVITWDGEETPHAAARAIDGWFEAPFHRFPLLSSHLDQVGYGEYCEAGACAAALNITSGGVSPSLAYRRRFVASGSLTTQEYGATALDTSTLFPPDGSTVPSGRFDGREWPDPLTSCRGYRPPTGLPISIQLGSWVKTSLSASSLSVNGSAIPTCGIDSESYTNPDFRTQDIGRNGLLESGAVIIIPRTPLPPGSTCKVSATVNGQQYNWSFTIAAHPEESL